MRNKSEANSKNERQITTQVRIPRLLWRAAKQEAAQRDLSVGFLLARTLEARFKKVLDAWQVKGGVEK